MATFLAIDAGTTSIKAALFNLQGQMLGFDRQEYHLFTPAPGIVELDAPVYWEACRTAIANVLAATQIDPDRIVSVCVSSQGETLIPVNREGQPMRRAIVWLDNRATEEAREIATIFDPDTIYHTTGQPEVAPTWPACKLLWLKRHEPEIFGQAHKFLLVEDYLLYQLTGRFVTEFSVQTSSLLVDIVHKRWWQPMFDFLELSPDHMGELMEPSTPVGPLCARAANETGLSTRTIAVTGAMDQTVGAVGAGNVTPGIVTETTGGALAIVATLDRLVFDPRGRIPVNYHAQKDVYCMLPWGQTAGMALRWFRDRFYHLETQVALASGIDPYELMTAAARQVPAGSDGLVALPHLEGAFCPEFNPAARGVFFGVTLAHTKAHFVRALMEAVAYMLKRNLDLLEELGLPVTEVRSMGGGARSPLWLRIKADVLQKPMRTLEVEETACLGAAVMGATATGQFDSVVEGVQQMVHLRETVEPSERDRAAYQEGYSRYCELYQRLEPMFT